MILPGDSALSTKSGRKEYYRWGDRLVRAQTDEEDAQAERLASGQDPDEWTIYNVLCPKIREGWSKAQVESRRVFRPEPMAVMTMPDPYIDMSKEPLL
jgi:hypothetical protein